MTHWDAYESNGMFLLAGISEILEENRDFHYLIGSELESFLELFFSSRSIICRGRYPNSLFYFISYNDPINGETVLKPNKCMKDLLGSMEEIFGRSTNLKQFIDLCELNFVDCVELSLINKINDSLWFDDEGYKVCGSKWFKNLFKDSNNQKVCYFCGRAITNLNLPSLRFFGRDCYVHYINDTIYIKDGCICPTERIKLVLRDVNDAHAVVESFLNSDLSKDLNKELCDLAKSYVTNFFKIFCRI